MGAVARRFGVRRRVVAVVAASACVAATTGTVPASGTTPPNNVGPYSFGNPTVTCSFASGKLTQTSVPSPAPRAAMRSYWTHEHSGRVAAGQYVVLDEILLAPDGRKGEYVEVAERHRSTLVGRKLTTLQAPVPFTVSAALRAKHPGLALFETIDWLRPTDNAYEGEAGYFVGRYRDGKSIRTLCPTDHPTVTTTSLPIATAGAAYRAQLRVTGIGPFTWTLVSAGGSGAKISKAGVLTAPAAAEPGHWKVTVRATEHNGLVATRSLTLTAVAPYGPPAAPAVSATSNGPGVTYNWSGSTPGHGVHYYVILDGSGVVQDEGVSPGSATLNRGYDFSYSISAFACDRFSQCSALTKAATGRTGDVPAPSPSCSGNGTTISCNWNAPAAGLTYRYRFDGGAWTSTSGNSASAGFGYSQTHSFGVQATDGAGHYSAESTTSATTGAPPSPSRTVSLSRGASSGSHSNCATNCFWLDFTVSGFSPGTYTYTCSDRAGQYYAGTVRVTNSTQNFAAGYCYAQSNYLMPQSMTVDGVQSNSASW